MSPALPGGCCEEAPHTRLYIVTVTAAPMRPSRLSLLVRRREFARARAVTRAVTFATADHPVLAHHQGGTVRHVRSTLLWSSITELQARGHYDAYVSHLPGSVAEVVSTTLAATWLPIEIGDAHFAACERLGLAPEVAEEIGGSSCRRLQQSLLNSFTFVARGTTDPLALFAAYPRVWNRYFDGGGMIAYQVGPKEVHMELREIPFFRYRYCHHAIRGMTRALVALFADTGTVREVAATSSSVAVRVSWA